MTFSRLILKPLTSLQNFQEFKRRAAVNQKNIHRQLANRFVGTLTFLITNWWKQVQLHNNSWTKPTRLLVGTNLRPWAAFSNTSSDWTKLTSIEWSTSVGVYFWLRECHKSYPSACTKWNSTSYITSIRGRYANWNTFRETRACRTRSSRHNPLLNSFLSSYEEQSKRLYYNRPWSQTTIRLSLWLPERRLSHWQ